MFAQFSSCVQLNTGSDPALIIFGSESPLSFYF